MPPPASSLGKPTKPGNKTKGGSRTRFLTVKKFNPGRVGKLAMSGVAVLVIAALVWCVFYFIH